MATFTNTVNSTDALVALGSPSLSAGDLLEFIRFQTRFALNADFSGTDLRKVTLGPKFQGSFRAQDGGALKLTCNRTSTGELINNSPADRIDLLSTGSTGVIYKVHQNGPGQLWLSACKTAGGLWASKGTTFIAGDVDLTNLYAGGSASVYQRKTAGAFVPTLVEVSGRAQCTMETDYATANVRGGLLINNDASVTPGQVNVYSGIFRPVESGTIGGLLLDGDGVLDFYSLAGPLVISGTTPVGPNCKIIYRKGGPLVTATFVPTSTNYEVVQLD